MTHNLLIIVADEMRRDALGCTGSPVVKSPHLDALAARGTVFTNAYTPSPMCVPARGSLATGKPVHQIGTWDSAAPYSGSPRSWMHELRDADIDITSIGKLHFRSPDDDNGFTREVIPLHVPGEVGWTLGLLRRDLPDYEETRSFAEDVGYGDTEYNLYDRDVTRLACEHIVDRNQTGGPWAAFVSYLSPHYPLRAPEAYAHLYDPRDMASPIGTDADPKGHRQLAETAGFYNYNDHFSLDRIAEAKAAYFALCTFIDDQVGALVATLEDTGQLDNTTIIFTSDHGEMLGDHGLWTKQVMYEASVGIPLIAAGPGFVRGKPCRTPVTLMDVHATALHHFEIQGGQESLQTIVRSADASDRVAFSEFHDGGSTTGVFMVRWDDWKYVHFEGGEPLLFNLKRDPDELDNVAADHPQEVEAGYRRLLNICDPARVNADAFADQERRIDLLGGEAACLTIGNFGHTPVPEGVSA